MEETAKLSERLEQLVSHLKKKDNAGFRAGEKLFLLGSCQILTHAKSHWEVLVEHPEEAPVEVGLACDEETFYCLRRNKATDWDSFAMAAVLQLQEELQNTLPRTHPAGKAYTREGMIKRVLQERRDKAQKAAYKINFADNIYGEHTLTNENGQHYKVTLRDFEKETGYIDNPDLKTNKLGTTKHIMFAFDALKRRPRTMNKLSRQYPFVEIYLNPERDYRISWHYPHPMPKKVQAMITKHFGKKRELPDSKVKAFLPFIHAAQTQPLIKIRPEVEQKVQKAWDRAMIDKVARTQELDYALLKITPFPYQKKGIDFATFKDGAIIADEMGLGKTLQAIGAAVMKKALFGFKRCLIVCPASLKEQWKQEIERFSYEEATIVDGFPEEREAIYENSTAYFLIANYETVLRDLRAMNRMDTDFIILDEAQRIKNFSTQTAQNIKKLQKKHALVITGTPIENRLIDLYSLMQFVDPEMLSPLWEFSYQHCYFDQSKKDKIVGYYNLQQLNKRLQQVLLRREKRVVIKELPQVTELTVPVSMHPDQADYHASFGKGVAQILGKKYISPYDWQKLMLLLNNMRMVCDSTYLIDKETHWSPKLEELRHILLEKLDVCNSDHKIIIFSEWVTMLNLIGQMLRENGIGYAQLSGRVAVKNRGKLVKKFENEPACKVFLSSEAGGSGLNLQVADTVINFELPWNPAKKNQRIGRIDRLGQRNKQLTVINLLTRGSIEIKIASGLSLKQNLFDGVLSSNGLDEVDFSAEGKAQFLRALEEAMEGLATPVTEELENQETPLEDKESIAALIEAEEEKEAKPDNSAAVSEAAGEPATDNVPEMEKVLNSGMDFLSGLLKMATGKAVGLENNRVEVDKKTGEVVMRFKLPIN